jgi:protein TonB
MRYEGLGQRARRSAAGIGARTPLLASFVAHALLVVLLVAVVPVGAKPRPKPGKFVTQLRAEKAPPPEPPELDPPPPAAEVEEVPVTLEEEAPPVETDLPEDLIEPSIDDSPAVIMLAPPLERCMAAGFVPRRRRADPAPEQRPAPVRVLRPMPTGPTRAASPLAGNPSPTYPGLAVTRRIEGCVVLLVAVTRDGKVTRVEVRESSGHPFLDREAVRAVTCWRFRPALRAGTPVAAVVEVPIRFDLG